MKPETEAVVLIHGLWLSGWSMRIQARRLRRCGYEVHVFSWSTVRGNCSENAHALQTFLASIAAPTVHLVGYSLGGVLIRALHHYFPSQRPGRIVTWGSPHNGSRAAASLTRFSFGRFMLGRSIAELLVGEPGRWAPPSAEIGTLVGVFPCGIGAVIAHLPRPHDGVVCVDEARFVGAREHIALPVSHVGMLWLRVVADQTCAFLRTGRFVH